MTKRNKYFIICLFILFALQSAFAIVYDDYFHTNTLRIDYFHTGTANNEFFSIDEIKVEDEWPGSRHNLIDTLNLGKYLIKIYDLKTNQLIFSKGYCTIFGEWQTTDEAQNIYKTFHETIRCPLPKRKIQLTIDVRNRDNVFINKYSTVIDPDSRFVNRQKQNLNYHKEAVINNGDPGKKVDLVILGDGYTENELEKFKNQVNYFLDVLFKVKPFDKYKSSFNVWRIDTPSTDTGIDEPRLNKWKSTVFETGYNSLDSPRYILTQSNKVLHDVAAMVPYDYIYIMVNSSRYGGGGIYNCMATSYTDSKNNDPKWWPDYVFVHEFGHLFAGLGDEYYSSNVAYTDFYPIGVDLWEPNITAFTEREKIKWADLIKNDTPLPTPWDKAKYDSLSNILSNIDRQSEEYVIKSNELKPFQQKILQNNRVSGVVGCFEGAGYVSEGLYRPGIDCRMFSKTVGDFCPVCQAAIIRMIGYYSN